MVKLIIPFGLKLGILSTLAEIFQFLLFPILHYQGNKVKKNAKILPEAVGKRFGNSGNGKAINALILGDSSACGVGVKSIKDSLSGYLLMFLKHEFNCHWKILAKSGIKTVELTDQVRTITHEKFDFIILAVGVNDMTARKSAHTWYKDILELIQILRNDLKAPQIICCGIPPVRKITIFPFPLKQLLSFKAFIYDLCLKKICKRLKGVHFVPHNFPVNKDTMAEDHLHPGKLYYKNWGKKLSEVLRDIYKN